MNFSIQSISENGLSIIRLANSVTHTMVDILPSYGTLLHAFTIQTVQGPFNIIDNYKDKGTIESQLSLSYKSSKLSPFACRIPAGKYEWKNSEFEFTTKFNDGSAIHGLLFNKVFSVDEQYFNNEKASVKLSYHYIKEDPGYPFEYRCSVIYTLYPDNTLQVETTLHNLDKMSIPIADGWHPYFTLGSKVNSYELKFASHTMLEFNEQLVPTGKFIHEPSFINANPIGKRLFDNCFLLQLEEGAPVCTLYNPSNKLTLSFYTNKNYPYLQIYIPDHRNSIAIENLSCAPNCFNNGMGLKTLLSGQTETFNVTYKLHQP